MKGSSRKWSLDFHKNSSGICAFRKKERGTLQKKKEVQEKGKEEHER